MIPDPDQFDVPDNLEDAQLQIRQLKVHLGSGEPCTWQIITNQEGVGYRFDDFATANAQFDHLPDEWQPVLLLWTRIGSACRFRAKGLM